MQSKLKKRLLNALGDDVTILIVEGLLKRASDGYVYVDGDRRGFRYSAIVNALLSYQMQGIKVLMSPDTRATSAMRTSLHKYFQKEHHSGLVCTINPEFYVNRTEAAKLSILMGFPSIGESKARALLEHFGYDLSAIFSADVSQLTKIDGIGQKTATEFFALLGHPVMSNDVREGWEALSERLREIKKALDVNGRRYLSARLEGEYNNFEELLLK